MYIYKDLTINLHKFTHMKESNPQSMDLLILIFLIIVYFTYLS